MIYQFIKNWVLSIVLMMIFLVLIDLIVPSNNFKKYVKFVAGLIMITVILTPVFKVFAKNVSIEGYISKYCSAFDSAQSSSTETNNYKGAYYKQISDKYKQNLKSKIESEIKSKTKSNYSVKDIEINSNTDDKGFGQIKYIEISGGGGGTIQVDKIVIGKDQNKCEALTQKDKDVIKLLQSEFGIDPSVVKILK